VGAVGGHGWVDSVFPVFGEGAARERDQLDVRSTRIVKPRVIATVGTEAMGVGKGVTLTVTRTSCHHPSSLQKPPLHPTV
jgi:hypothetical protein